MLIILIWLKILNRVINKDTESSYKAAQFKDYKNIFSNVYTKNWLKEIFVINSVLKTNPWTYKTKDLNGEKVIGSFYENELLLSKL